MPYIAVGFQWGFEESGVRLFKNHWFSRSDLFSTSDGAKSGAKRGPRRIPGFLTGIFGFCTFEGRLSQTPRPPFGVIFAVSEGIVGRHFLRFTKMRFPPKKTCFFGNRAPAYVKTWLWEAPSRFGRSPEPTQNTQNELRRPNKNTK